MNTLIFLVILYTNTANSLYSCSISFTCHFGKVWNSTLPRSGIPSAGGWPKNTPGHLMPCFPAGPILIGARGTTTWGLRYQNDIIGHVFRECDFIYDSYESTWVPSAICDIGTISVVRAVPLMKNTRSRITTDTAVYPCGTARRTERMICIALRYGGLFQQNNNILLNKLRYAVIHKLRK